MPAVYDPNTEATSTEKVIAGRWELLRRNAEFRAISKRWVASEQFRREHALTTAYHDMRYHAPRCGLDWMLTAEQRAELAEYQIERLRWFFDGEFNFGPIVCIENFSPALLTKENWRDFLKVKAKFNPPPPISVDLSWDRTPALFKEQFSRAYGSSHKFGEFNPHLRALGDELRIMAKKLGDGDPSAQTPIAAGRLFKLGSELLDVAEFCKVFQIPSERVSVKRFKSLLEKIEDNFQSAGLLIPTKKYDRHESYQGTSEDWHWFLEAERLGLDVRKSADVRALAELYSEELRHRTMRGQAPRRAKPYGHTGLKIPSSAIKNRRNTIRRHVESIKGWIRRTYPPVLA